MSKKILIIGGGSGIGRKLIDDLLAMDFEIVAASRNIGEADLPSEVERQTYDISGNGELQVPDALDGLVYCPGTINLQPFPRFSADDLRHEMEVNYFGAVRVIQQCIRALKKAQGSVVLFSTVAVQTGLPFHTAVSAAKGAVEGLVRSLAAEYAPAIRFNAVAPSLTDTPMASQLLSSEKKRDSNAGRHPLKRIGKPEDISSMAAYLLSDKANWISGQILKVDGGMSDLRPL